MGREVITNKEIALILNYIEETTETIEGEFGLGRSFSEVWNYNKDDSDAIDENIKKIYTKLSNILIENKQEG